MLSVSYVFCSPSPIHFALYALINTPYYFATPPRYFISPAVLFHFFVVRVVKASDAVAAGKYLVKRSPAADGAGAAAEDVAPPAGDVFSPGGAPPPPPLLLSVRVQALPKVLLSTPQHSVQYVVLRCVAFVVL